jgi:hypothetical protein
MLDIPAIVNIGSQSKLAFYLNCKRLRTWPFLFFAGNSQEYSYTPQLHIKEMIVGVEVGVATKWLAVQVGVDSAVMPVMVADFVRTNCFCCILVDFTDEESAIQQCQTLSIFLFSVLLL